MKISKIILLVLLLVSAIELCQAQVKLPQIIRDSMVLQRNNTIRIWGWATQGEEISVKFNGKTRSTVASSKGDWQVDFPKMKAGGPYKMVIKASNEITLDNILIGDIWLCAGQSNMVHQLDIHDVTYADEIKNANYYEIRHFKIPTQTNLNAPAKDFEGGAWNKAVSEEVRSFSAVAYFFAKKIYEKNKVPIGLINASVGGTPIESWISEEGFKEFPDVLKTIDRNKDTTFLNDLIRKNKEFETQHPKTTIDKGIAAPVKWYESDFIPKNWRSINIPGYWEDQGIRNLDGTVWYRKEIDIPATMVGKQAKVFLGRIIDANTLYINGKKIAETTYQYPQRRYPIASDVLKPGKNTFVIKVTNYNNKGGFVPDKPYYLFAGNDTVDLKGTWHYKVGEVFEPKPIPSFDSPINTQNQPAALYNAMIAPYTQLTFKGLLWYQGESNTGEPEKYGAFQETLIKDWRKQFQQPNIPFIYAQLPNFMDVNYTPEESKWAEFRAAQMHGLHQPNTAMTINIDLGEWNDIHPDNKKDVGERMALAAFRLAYNEDVVYSGPLYKSHTIKGNKIIISFSHIGSALITKDNLAPHHFAIAGSDKKWVWADAKIEDNKVMIWNENIPNPKYARYAWADNPDNPNLYNKEGLPASPFTTE